VNVQEPSSGQTGGAGGGAPELPQQPRASGKAVAAVIVAGVFFVAMVGVLFYRSLYKAPPEPSAMLLVNGSEHYRGAVVTIEGPGLLDRRVLSAENRYTWRRLLPPGVYAVKVEQGGRTVYETWYTRLEAGQIGTVTLPSPRTRPATAPASR